MNILNFFTVESIELGGVVGKLSLIKQFKLAFWGEPEYDTLTKCWRQRKDGTSIYYYGKVIVKKRYGKIYVEKDGQTFRSSAKFMEEKTILPSKKTKTKK